MSDLTNDDGFDMDSYEQELDQMMAEVCPPDHDVHDRLNEAES